MARLMKSTGSLAVACVLAGGLAISAPSLFGQSAQPAPSPKLGPIATEFEGLHFRSIGPASMSGRVADLAVYDANPAVFYVATAHGGVWKTTSNGALFEAQFQDQGLMSIGDVVISQTNPNLVWIGTGESNNRQSTSWGDGVYKSTDGGKTWKHMGLAESRHINRVLLHPANSDVVFVAATGPLWGPGGERGIYKSTDGGTTWKQVLKVDDDTGANELVMSPSDPNIMFASSYQRRRTQCCMNGGGPGSGVWKSTDGGDTWTRLQGGLPTGPMGRIAIDVFRSSSNIVYALIEGEGPVPTGRGRGGVAPAPEGQEAPQAVAGGRGGRGGAPGGAGAADTPTGFYRSDDGGTSWRKMSSTNPRPMYFSKVRIDPNNPDRVYLGGVGLHVSVDGGRTFQTDAALVIHDDIHAIWVNPANPNHVVIGGDGGVAQSYDAARSWIQIPNLPLALFYHVGYDMATPFNVCGGLQDNYNWCGPSATRSTRGIRNADWFQVQGGDGFVSIIDQRNPRIVYSESQDGNIQRKDIVTGESRNIRPTAANISPAPVEGAPPFRFHWDTPMVFSATDPSKLIVAANKVFVSNDKGDSWNVISGDLTTNADRGEIVTMGVVGNQIRIAANDGIANWPSIVALAESAKQPGVYFTGTDDGVVSMTRDGGKTWTNITDRLPGFPKGAFVSEVVPSRFDANTVYVTVDAHRLNDYKTYMWASTDAGATFRSVNANLSTEVVKTLTEDTKNPDVLYIGTETGLFLTLDRGKSWRRLKANLPTVRIDEITIHPRDNAMILATHGRAVWILDHLEPIQEQVAAQAADAKLFTPGPAMQWRLKDDQNDEFWGHQFFVGENPPADAIIQFQLKKAVGALGLKVTDTTGRDVRELVVPANRNAAGIQTVCWDMRVQPLPAPAAPAGAPGGGRAGGGGGAAGGGRAGGGAPQTGPLAGMPVQLPPSGSDPQNACGGGGAGFGGGGGFGGGAGGGTQGPLVLPGTYNVNLLVDGKVVDTKPIKVSADPDNQLTDLQRRRYSDVVTDLHDMQRRGQETANALTPFFTQMNDIAAKLPAMDSVPADVKAQFETLNKEFATVRARFGIAAPAAAGAGPGGGGGGGGRGGGAPADPNNVLARLGTVKTQILAFTEMPSDALLRAYNDVKLAAPKAVSETNAFLVKAGAMSQVLKKYDVALTVPPALK